jgi:hypothetical protein
MIDHVSCDSRHVRLAYQPPASSIFLSQQISHQQPANSTFLSEQTSTSRQPPAKRTGCQFMWTDLERGVRIVGLLLGLAHLMINKNLFGLKQIISA